MNFEQRYEIENVETPIGNRIIKSWTKGVVFEENAKQQVRNLLSLPFIPKHIAVMPDVHGGLGSTIGSVIPTLGAIIPATVSVDIGCGMIATKTSLKASDLPESLSAMRSSIEETVPHGRTNNGQKGDRGAWGKPPEDVWRAWLQPMPGKDARSSLDYRFINITHKYPKIAKCNNENHLGTLGTGNHFIEVCLDENDDVWIMLHSGSRGVGNRIGSYFIELAKKDMQKWFINLPDKDLSYFPEGTEHFSDYIEAVKWAQDYARINREIMLERVKKALQSHTTPFTITEKAINCHHNYVDIEHHFGKNMYITRKGAVRARVGDLGIIPGSMGAKSFIVEGLGNKESYNSCSHGAGRIMSRTKARKVISLEEHTAAVKGVECRIDADVIDESPGAYKDIDAVMAAQSDLVKIKHTLKQVLCVKG